MTTLSQDSQRLLHVRFSPDAERLDVFRTLSRASVQLTEREDECDLLVHATDVRELGPELDVELLSWVLIHDAKLRLIAVVCQQCDGCRERLDQLTLLGQKSIHRFDDELTARRWLATHPWSPPTAA